MADLIVADGLRKIELQLKRIADALEKSNEVQVQTVVANQGSNAAEEIAGLIPPAPAWVTI